MSTNSILTNNLDTQYIRLNGVVVDLSNLSKLSDISGGVKEFVEGNINVILGGGSSVYDTLIEIKTILENNNNVNNTLVQYQNKVDKYDSDGNLKQFAYLDKNNVWSGTQNFSGSVVTGLTKDSLGLAFVNNTSDLDKPISNAVFSELNKKVDKTSNDSAISTINTNKLDKSIYDAFLATNTTNLLLKLDKAVYESFLLTNTNNLVLKLDKTTYDNFVTTTTSNLNLKLDKTTYDAFVSSINNTLSNKLNTTDFLNIIDLKVSQTDFNNFQTSIITTIDDMQGITFSNTNGEDLTTINNSVIIPTGRNLYLGTSSYNVKTKLDNCITKLSNVNYTTLGGVSSTSITGNVVVDNLNGISSTILGYINGLSSDAQTQINTKTTLSAVQANNNVWTGINTFNTTLPTSNITPTTNTQFTTKAYVDTQVATKTDLATVQANTNTWTGQNSFNAQLYTNNLTSFYNGNFVVNAGASSSIKNLNMWGSVLVMYDALSGGTMTSIYRDQSSKNLYIDSSYFDNGVGGGVVFRLKDPNGLAQNYSDVLSVQPKSITMSQPLTLTSTINGISPTTLSYLDATSSIQTQFNTINTKLTGISYDSTQDITTINNHVLLPTGNNLLLGSTYNVKTNLDDCITKLSGITYTSGTDSTTFDNTVILNGKLQNQHQVYLGATKYLTGTYTNLDFPCEENILCNLTTFTYSNPYTLVLPPSSAPNNMILKISILTSSTFVKVYASGTGSIRDPNRVIQDSIMLSPDSFISITVLLTSSGWVVTDYATNNNLVSANSVSTYNLYMYGPITISSYIAPTTSAQIGYVFSGNYSVTVDNANQSYALISNTPFSIGAGTWIITTTANVIAPLVSTSFRMGWGFNTSSTNATPFLNNYASNVSGGTNISTAKNIATTFTYSESFCFTHSFSTSSSIYIWFYLRWIQTVTSSTYAIYYQCTRIA